jgi:hypothetical protein
MSRATIVLAAAAVAAVLACTPEAQQSAQDIARALQVEKGEKVGEVAPSSVFHLGNPAPKWFANDVGGGRLAATPGGGRTYLVELRGWLRDSNEEGKPPATDDARAVVPHCNAPDPDWHYGLEVDTKWAAGAGVDIGKVIRAGNILVVGHDATGPLSARVATPLVHVEAIGMDPAKPGQENAPAGWQTFGRCGDAKWAFDPLNPLDWQPDLAAGQYVRVFGGLVTDDPHSGQSVFPTEVFRLTGIALTAQGEFNGTLKRWAGGRPFDDPENASRYTEMHPPDIIAVLPDKAPEETFRAVAVSAENCLVACGGGSALDADIAPPGPKPSATATVGFEEIVLPGTLLRTITHGNMGDKDNTGAEVVVGADKITVKVTVRGQEAYGVHGRFAAIYRVFWKP